MGKEEKKIKSAIYRRGDVIRQHSASLLDHWRSLKKKLVSQCMFFWKK